MGQKVNPIGFRVGVVENWRGRWYASKKDFSDFLKEDVLIRDYLFARFPRGTLSRVETEKVADKVTVKLFTTRPGVILGRKGSEIKAAGEELSTRINKQVKLDVVEMVPGKTAQYLADSIASQLERRVPHRQVIKKIMSLAMQSGAEGIKIKVAGRIGGIEIARTEQYIRGKVPLHTLRAKIDYATSTAFSRSGTIGVKVWVYLGEILEDQQEEAKNAINAEKGKIQKGSKRPAQREGRKR